MGEAAKFLAPEIVRRAFAGMENVEVTMETGPLSDQWMVWGPSQDPNGMPREAKMDSDMTKKILEIIAGLENRVAKLESKLAGGATVAAAGGADAPTPRMKYPNGDWVYDVSGLQQVKDRNTGEPGHWVKTKNGKSALCDVMGYVIWDDERPLKHFNGDLEQAKAAVNKGTEVPF